MARRHDAGLAPPVVLASASPRRRDLLLLLGISFSVQAADVDEEPEPGESPETLTTRLARTKALAVSRAHPAPRSADAFIDISRSMPESCRGDVTAGEPVLAADTVVVLDGAILGKPADDAEARTMLRSLRGRPHRVLTGCALAASGEIVWSSVVETTVWMRQYGDDEIERYVRSGSPRDKAGAYGIQDIGFRPVERIEGCLSNVVGLPLCEVRLALTALDPERSWAPGWHTASAQLLDSDGHLAVCGRALER
jgi:septum formation protein